MNERQKRFVDYYVQTGCASKAARLSGYSPRTARHIGTELVAKPDIQAAVMRRLEEMASERTATTEEILERLTSILRGEETELIVTPSGKKITTPARISDRLRAAEHLLRVSGAFNDKVNVKTDLAQLYIETLKQVEADG